MLFQCVIDGLDMCQPLYAVTVFKPRLIYFVLRFLHPLQFIHKNFEIIPGHNHFLDVVFNGRIGIADILSNNSPAW